MFVIEERSLWSVLGAAAVAMTLGFGFNALLPVPSGNAGATTVAEMQTIGTRHLWSPVGDIDHC